MRTMGLSSGTSMDGIDVVVADFDMAGDELQTLLCHAGSTAYSPALRERLQRVIQTGAMSARECCQLDTLIGREFGAAAGAAIAATGPVDLVCSHGQTIYHWTEDGRVRGTLQLGQAAFIAQAAAAAVVSDVRAADVAAGGQGAPLVPVLDVLLLGGEGTSAALNLGGIANLTVVEYGRCTHAYDIGPANALIDAVAQAAGMPGFDVEGHLAAQGRAHAALLERLLSDPYYRRPWPKSTGKEHFNLEYLRTAQGAVNADRLSWPDLAATVTELTARTVGDAVRASGAASVYVSGGGARNPTLMGALRSQLPATRLASSSELGVDPDLKEALAFALIGWLTAHGLPGNVPAATGAGRSVVLGSLTAPDGRPTWPQLLLPPARMTVTDGRR